MVILTILNGRYGKDKNIGNTTFRGNSVIDYTISSIKGFSLLSDFEIIETDSLLSDGHSIIAFCIDMPARAGPSIPMTKSTTPRKAKWRQTESHLFVENINREHIQEITRFLRRFNESPSQESLDIAVNKLTETFILSANTSFPRRPIPCFKSNNRNKPGLDRTVNMHAKFIIALRKNITPTDHKIIEQPCNELLKYIKIH